MKPNAKNKTLLGFGDGYVTVNGLKNFLDFPFAALAVDGDSQHDGLGERQKRITSSEPVGEYSLLESF